MGCDPSIRGWPSNTKTDPGRAQEIREPRLLLRHPVGMTTQKKLTSPEQQCGRLASTHLAITRYVVGGASFSRPLHTPHPILLCARTLSEARAVGRASAANGLRRQNCERKSQVRINTGLHRERMSFSTCAKPSLNPPRAPCPITHLASVQLLSALLVRWLPPRPLKLSYITSPFSPCVSSDARRSSMLSSQGRHPCT